MQGDLRSTEDLDQNQHHVCNANQIYHKENLVFATREVLHHNLHPQVEDYHPLLHENLLALAKCHAQMKRYVSFVTVIPTILLTKTRTSTTG